GSATEACGFEGGTERWTDPEQASFVLFGTPDSPFAVEIDGLRESRSVTATRAQTRLPSRAGERATLPLALFDRTEPRFRCAIDLPVPNGRVELSTAPEAQTAITAGNVARGPGLELLLSVDGELWGATVLPEEASCRLAVVRLRDAEEDRSNPVDFNRWCRVYPGSLTIRPYRDNTRLMVTSLCAQAGGAAGSRIKVAQIDADGVDIRTINLEVPLDRVSLPIIADAMGTDEPDIFFLVQVAEATESAPVRLVRYSPRRQESISIDLGNYEALTLFGDPVPAPMVIDGPRGDAILVAGHPGPAAIYDGTQTVELMATGERNFRAPVVIELPNALLLQELRNQRVVSTRILTDQRRTTWRVVDTVMEPLPSFVVPDDGVRLSVGVNPDGLPVVAYSHNGAVWGWLVSDDLNVDRIDTLSTTAGSQPVLHVNLDGELGTELVTFARDSNIVRATTQTGQALVGWPVNLTGDSGVRHVLLTDLGRSTDVPTRSLRAAEVVALTYRHLEVITLGAGSYDQSRWSWPAADGASAGRWSSPSDPYRR
ncbi:MAG: hypothetical protein AAF449_15980, partial [Myxococcota bacterium]